MSRGPFLHRRPQSIAGALVAREAETEYRVEKLAAEAGRQWFLAGDEIHEEITIFVGWCQALLRGREKLISADGVAVSRNLKHLILIWKSTI